MSCSVCGGVLRVFLSIENAPVSCSLNDTAADAASVPRGTIALAFCSQCGLISNTAFDPASKTPGATRESSEGGRREPETDIERLAARLIARYHLRDKDVVEIGCGGGELLEQLCHRNGNRGVGYDPRYTGAPVRINGAHLRFVSEHFTKAHAHLAADLVVCRGVLEQVASPAEVLDPLERSDAVVYFETGDAERMLRTSAWWDVRYERVSYFTRPALRRLFAEHGLHPIDLDRTRCGRNIYIEAARRAYPFRAFDAPSRFGVQVDAFAGDYLRTVTDWAARLSELRRRGRRVAIWGAGPTSVMFVNCVDGGEAVDAVIDPDRGAQGQYVPGTGHQVGGIEAVDALRPDLVLVAEGQDTDELVHHLRDAQLEPEVGAL